MQARPYEFRRLGHPACPHRVQLDAADHGQDESLAVDKARPEPAFPQRTRAPMSQVEPLHAALRCIAHGAGNGSCHCGRDQQVHVIAHQHMGMRMHALAREGRREQLIRSRASMNAAARFTPCWVMCIGTPVISNRATLGMADCNRRDVQAACSTRWQPSAGQGRCCVQERADPDVGSTPSVPLLQSPYSMDSRWTQLHAGCRARPARPRSPSPSEGRSAQSGVAQRGQSLEGAETALARDPVPLLQAGSIDSTENGGASSKPSPKMVAGAVPIRTSPLPRASSR